MKKYTLAFILLSCLSLNLSAQKGVGVGLTLINDWYSWIQNPTTDGGGNAGNALLNLGLGPKIWLGGEDVSVSVEAAAVLGMTTLDFNTYKGMGAAYFPIMAKLNFGGMTGLDKEGEFGWYVGFGTQYTRTELYGVRQSFIDEGGSRSLFDTYIAQVGYGFGMSGFSGSVFGKYGWNVDTDARLLSLGLQFDFNLPMIKKISSPESSL